MFEITNYFGYAHNPVKCKFAGSDLVFFVLCMCYLGIVVGPALIEDDWTTDLLSSLVCEENWYLNAS